MKTCISLIMIKRDVDALLKSTSVFFNYCKFWLIVTFTNLSSTVLYAQKAQSLCRTKQ